MRRRLAFIVLIAFAIRALLPPGFMIAPAGADAAGFQVVICTSQGWKLVTLDDQGQPIEQGDNHGTGSITCAYGPPPLSLAAVDAIDLTFEAVAERVAHDRTRTFLLKRRAQEVRFARGPPLHISI